MSPARLWPLAIIGVLAVTVIVNGMLLYAAGDRRHAAVEADYYRKAVEWDSTLAQRDRNSALGWRLDAELVTGARGESRLMVRLTDSLGTAIEGAALAVAAIHNLDPEHPVCARLVSGADGSARTRLPLRFAGTWELRLEAVRGADRFTADLRRELRASP